MENVLYIDCSNGLKIGVITNKLCKEYFDDTAKKHSSSLMVKIDQLLKEAGLKITDINVIAVCVGPGSFTGIRVAISTAKGLCIGTNAKVVTFTSFDSLSVNDRNYGILVEGFGNNYYYHFKKYGKVFEGCDQPQKLQVLAKDINVYSCNNLNINEFNVTTLSYNPKPVILDKIQKGEWILSNQIAPLYLRASQAELERLKNGH